MEPRHHGLEHQADVRPHPRLTRLRCGSSADRPPRKRRYPAPSTAFCTQSNAQRRRNPPKSFAAIKRNTQSDRLLDRDYVIFARAHGLSSPRIAFAYVLRNALIPVVTAAGLIVVGIVAGAIYVEVTFSLPGLGALTVDAVQKRDIPTIQGATLVFSVFVVLVNLTIDVIYTLIDPRIRFGRVES
jgi:hypothetical protein